MDEHNDRPHPWEQSLLPYVPTQTNQTIREMSHQATKEALREAEGYPIYTSLTDTFMEKVFADLAAKAEEKWQGFILHKPRSHGKALSGPAGVRIIDDPIRQAIEDAQDTESTPTTPATAPRRRRGRHDRWI